MEIYEAWKGELSTVDTQERAEVGVAALPTTFESSEPPINIAKATLSNLNDGQRAALPAELTALQQFILLEVQRLQEINYRDDRHLQDCKEQVFRYVAMYDALEGLRPLVELGKQAEEADAARATSYLRAFVGSFRESFAADPVEAGAIVAERTKDAAKLGILAGTTSLVAVLSPFAAVPIALTCQRVLYPGGGKVLLDIAKAWAERRSLGREDSD